MSRPNEKKGGAPGAPSDRADQRRVKSRQPLEDAERVAAQRAKIAVQAMERGDRPEKNIFNLVADVQNLRHATRQINPNPRGPDGLARSDVDDVDAFVKPIHQRLVEGTSEPSPVRKVMANGRPAMVANLASRIEERSLVQIVEPIFETLHFLPYSYGFRPGRDVAGVINGLRENHHRYQYAVRVDIKRAFPSVNHAPLKRQFRRRVKDRKVLRMLNRLLQRDGDAYGTPGKGLILGGQASPMLFNVACTAIDEVMVSDHDFSPPARSHAFGYAFGGDCLQPSMDWDGPASPLYLRYADDLVVLTPGGREQAIEVLDLVNTAVTSIGLSLNHKTTLAPLEDGLDFLGLRLQRAEGKLQVGIPDDRQRKMADRLLRALAVPGEEQREKKIREILNGWRLHYARLGVDLHELGIA